MDRQATDYLIIGAGAMGIAFADELFTQRPDLHLTIVDQRKHFGGHWLDAYDFVGLHQPAAFYGVNSLKLENNHTDLSSKSEILNYYKTIRDKFAQSGRVQFLGGHKYIGDYKVSSIGQPDQIIHFEVRKKLVDSTYMKVEVPATHPPRFKVDDGVNIAPLNALVQEHPNHDHFYVIGCGKTGMDAILYLLEKGVEQERINWIAPNDAWLFNRERAQIRKTTKMLLEHGAYMTRTEQIDEVFLAMEAKGSILRLDKTVVPIKWRCATVSPSELNALQKLQNIIRKGRVKQLTPNEIILEGGTLSYPRNTLFVDCTANGLAKKDRKSIFSKNHITLQPIAFCQQVFSAAVIAKLELSGKSDEHLNTILPVPHPEYKEDWLPAYYTTIKNLLRLNLIIPAWLYQSRLYFMSHETPWHYLWYSLKTVWMMPSLRKAFYRNHPQLKEHQ